MCDTCVVCLCGTCGQIWSEFLTVSPTQGPEEVPAWQLELPGSCVENWWVWQPLRFETAARPGQMCVQRSWRTEKCQKLRGFRDVQGCPRFHMPQMWVSSSRTCIDFPIDVGINPLSIPWCSGGDESNPPRCHGVFCGTAVTPHPTVLTSQSDCPSPWVPRVAPSRPASRRPRHRHGRYSWWWRSDARCIGLCDLKTPAIARIESTGEVRCSFQQSPAYFVIVIDIIHHFIGSWIQICLKLWRSSTEGLCENCCTNPMCLQIMLTLKLDFLFSISNFRTNPALLILSH